MSSDREDLVASWRRRTEPSAGTKRVSVHQLRCAFDELLAAYSDCMSSLAATTETLKETQQREQKLARECKKLRAALHDDMFRETP